MRQVRLPVVAAVCALMLTACSSVEERQQRVLGVLDDVKQTATGAVESMQGEIEEAMGIGHSIKEGFENLVEGTQSLVESAKSRVEKVQSGMLMLQEGKELIEEGMGGEEESGSRF